jgi:hypothetical protein
VVVPVLVGVLALWWQSRRRTAPALRMATVIVLVVVALVATRAMTTATGNQDSRLGYATAHWHRAALMRDVRALPRSAWIVTNAPEAVYLQTGRPARGLPSKFSSTSLETQSDYARRLDALITDTESHRGVFVMFDEVKGRPWLPRATDLERDPRLRVVARVVDGVVLAPAG